MLKSKKVVVVMPAYNAARTLRQTYKEVREQQVVDEVILVDDRSRDETVEVARGADNTWGLTQPTEAKADQASAEAAATQVSTIRILDTVPNVDPKIVGLADPEYATTWPAPLPNGTRRTRRCNLDPKRRPTRIPATHRSFDS